MDITTTTPPPPPPAQNFNSEHTYFATSQLTCVLADGYSKRRVPDASFVAGTSTRPQVNTDLEHIKEQARNTPTATHTVTSALNIAHAKHTEPTAKTITGQALRAAHPPCSIYHKQVIIVKQKQRRARKGLTSQRYRTVIRTISTGGCNCREQKEEALHKRKSLISGCKKREHLYL
jgi:hypothetical protein